MLSGILTSRTLQDGEVLIEEGRADNALHVIARGRLEVSRRVAGGEFITLHVLKEGDLAGAMGFIDGAGHSATLKAMGEVTIFSMERAAFESLITSHPRLVYRVMRGIIRAVHGILLRMNQQYVEMSNYIRQEHGRY